MRFGIDFAIGYGIKIESDTFDLIEARISDDDDCDAWCNRWAQCLDLLTGDDYFVGVIYLYDAEGGVVSLNSEKAALDPKDEKDFRDFYNKYHLEDFFEWAPNPSAIIFVR